MSNSKFIIQKWLDSQKLTLKEKKDIKNLSLQEQNIFFADETMKFGTAGVRGKMGPGTTRMNRFAYANLTQAYAKYIVRQYGKNKSIVVGHDNRMNSDVYALLAAKVLSSFGIKVLLFNKNSLMPTPIVSYAIRQTNSVGGLIITASHNPKEYNGFKAYHDDGGQILPDIAKMVEQHFIKPTELLDFEYTPKPKLISFLSNGIVEHYFKDAQCVLINRKELKEKKKYPIVLTAHHGTASKLLPKFLNNLNFKIKPVRAQMFYSPTFVNSPISNPEDIKSFDLSIKQADQLHSDICIGVDPDADRMAVCIKHNEKWRLITGNEMGTIYTYYCLKYRKFTKTPYVVSSYVSTYLIDRIVKEYKGKVYRTGTGFKWMGAKITEIGNKQSLVVAFEEAIGALNTTIDRDKDSFTASALALEIYNFYKVKQMDLVDMLEKEIYPKYGQWFGKTDSFTYDVLEWKPVLQSKMKLLKEYHSKKIGSFAIKQIVWNKLGDCLEWHLHDDSWIKFRLSGTEPKFKIYYNLFGSSQSVLIKQYNELDKTFRKMIGA